MALSAAGRAPSGGAPGAGGGLGGVAVLLQPGGVGFEESAFECCHLVPVPCAHRLR